MKQKLTDEEVAVVVQALDNLVIYTRSFSEHKAKQTAQLLQRIKASEVWVEPFDQRS